MKGLILDKSPAVNTLVLIEPINARMVGKPSLTGITEGLSVTRPEPPK
jgi:hypothetical protein